MLGKLRIRCINSEFGCEEIVLLDNLKNHQIICCLDEKIIFNTIKLNFIKFLKLIWNHPLDHIEQFQKIGFDKLLSL